MDVKTIEKDVLIIGAGPAGLTAALYTARAGKSTLVLEGRAASRMAVGYELENYPGFPTINSLELLDKFKDQAKGHGAEFLSGDALAFSLESADKFVTTKDSFIQARTVIIATGKPFQKGRMIPGEEKLTGKGVSYCPICDGPLFRGKDVAAYGRSEDAVEDVLALHQAGCQVHWIPGGKGEALPAETEEKVKNAGIRIYPGVEIAEISGSDRVEGLLLKGGEPASLDVSAVFIFREIPAAPLFEKAGLILDHKQCLSVDRFQRTNLEGVYAAGDVTCGGLQVVSAAGEGCVAALQALAYLRK